MNTYSKQDDYSFGGKLYRFSEDVPDGTQATLVGILFARPEFDVVSKELLASLKYFDERSSDKAWFFLAGYEMQSHLDNVSADLKTGHWVSINISSPATLFVRVSENLDLYFSNTEFNDVRERIEEFSTWRYSGGVDLLMLNMRRETLIDDWRYDFSSTLNLRLDNLKDSKLSDGIGILFEKIFRYAESVDPADPVAGLSDYLGMRTARTSAIKVLLSLLPKDIGAELQKVATLAIKDLTLK